MIFGDINIQMNMITHIIFPLEVLILGLIFF